MTNVHPSKTPTLSQKPSFVSWRAPEVCACLSLSKTHISIVQNRMPVVSSLDSTPRVLPEVVFHTCHTDKNTRIRTTQHQDWKTEIFLM